MAVHRIAHLSDLHHQLDWRRRSLSSTGWRGALGRFELHGMGRLKRFHGVGDKIRRLIDRVQRDEPDLVILTGDLSALGDADELAQVRALFQPFIDAGRLHLIPGNHDRYTDHPKGRRFERLFGDLLSTELPELADAHGYPFVRRVGEKLAVVGLDSTRVGALSQYFFGRLGDDQLERLERVLKHPLLAGRTVLVLSHHGPLGPGGAFHWRESALLDAGRLLKAIHDRPAVLFHGHSHRRYWHGRRGARPHLFGGGSSTEPGSQGYWLIELEDHLSLEARSLSP